jgi:hypothetical protein
MKKLITSSAIFLAALVLFSSCASIVSKSIYPVSFNSSPSNATLTITDNRGIIIYHGTTPATVNLKAGSGFFTRADYQVWFSLEGYDDKVVSLSSSIDGWYFGNIFLGTFIGMLIIDPATGAMWKLDVQNVHGALNPWPVSDNYGMQLLDINDLPESLKDQLVQINQ